MPPRKAPLAGRAAATVDLNQNAAIYREGEYWTIAYAGTVFRLRDAKGFHLLAHLLEHPGHRVSALELLAIPNRPHTLEPLSPQARKPSSPQTPEEARVLVTKHIRSAVTKIAVHHPSLGHHLGTCIKTGAYCVYLPDPERPIVWTQKP